MSAAWLLGDKHDVVLFEADRRPGGHSNTVTVAAPEGDVAIDTGFIVYNTASYPNLIAFFDALGVETAPSNMSFAVSMDGGRYEYSGDGLLGLFGQPANLLKTKHWWLVGEIFRFFREAEETAKIGAGRITLGEWLEARKYSDAFIDAHIVPMASAIWSAPASEILGFPFEAFARFFSNHGLLQAFGRPEWRTVKGGSRMYVERAVAGFGGVTVLGDSVVSVKSATENVTILTKSGRREVFDAAVLACHANDALNVIEAPPVSTSRLLSAFRYQRNDAILHTDISLMPSRKRLWSSWNYMGRSGEGAERGAAEVSVSYWMNRLQPLPTRTNYFVTLNPEHAISHDAVIQREVYWHPLFDRAAIDAQKALPSLQGQGRLWLAGSYFGYGFHEDGIQSGLAAAEHLSMTLCGEHGSVRRPWRWDESKSRIALPQQVGVKSREAAL